MPAERHLRRIALVLLACGLGPWFLTAAALDHYGQRRPDGQRYDAIVVAGCRVDPGGVPSPALRARTELAVALYEEGLAPQLAFTGGLGANPPTEAQAAADHARNLGVPAENIRLEDRSTSTEENAHYLAREHQ